MKQRTGIALSLILLTLLTTVGASQSSTNNYKETLPLEEAAHYDVSSVDCYETKEVKWL
jgi:hypothetical protein